MSNIITTPKFDSASTDLEVTTGIASSLRQNNFVKATLANYKTINKMIPEEGGGLNLKIGVTSSPLTVSLVGLNGAVPSAIDINDPETDGGNEVWVRIGGNIYTITSAVSVTLDNGTNWLQCGSAELQGEVVQLFVYVLYNNVDDDINIGVSRVPYALKFGDFETGNTSEKGAKFDAITVPDDDDKCVVIGRFNCKLNSSYTWQTVADKKIINRPVFKTDMLDWSPTYGAEWDNNSDYAYYMIDGDVLSWFHRDYSTANAINYDSSLFRISKPLNCIDEASAGSVYCAMSGYSSSTGSAYVSRLGDKWITYKNRDGHVASFGETFRVTAHGTYRIH